MRVALQLTRALALGAVLGASFGCANKRHSQQSAPGAASAQPELPEPPGLLGEFHMAHPEASYRAFRELGRPLASLLPTALPLLVVNVLGLPPLAADSFDSDVPVVGALLQSPSGQPAWLLALHVVSGPELIAKLTTGDRAPFRSLKGGPPGLSLLEPSAPAPGSDVKPAFALGVFDNYLLVASDAAGLPQAGPFVARMLPRRPPPKASLALRFGKHALSSAVAPTLRGLWASTRTRLAHMDHSDRSAHGGRAPDFADPAQVILGADVLVESWLTTLEHAAAVELDLEPSPDRLDATVVLEPEPGSELAARLSTVSAGNAQSLLTLPIETQLALGWSRAAAEREAAGKAAGEDWIRLLGPRLSAADAAAVRSALGDWELGRGTLTRYGFFGRAEPAAFLVADVADRARLRQAAPGLLGLLALPGLRAPLTEFFGQPKVSEPAPGPAALPEVSRRQLLFRPANASQPALPALGIAWLVEEQLAFAAASPRADAALALVVQSARGQHPTLAAVPGLPDAVRRMGEQATLFAYADARLLFEDSGVAVNDPAQLVLGLGKREQNGFLRLEIAHAAVDLALRGASAP